MKQNYDIGKVINLMAFVALAVVLLAGCQSGEDFPVYQMEIREDYSEVLYIDNVQYQRNLSDGWDEQAHYYGDGAQYVWRPAEGIGEQIGICGEGADRGGELAVYEIAGDEGRTFLYTAPRKFYFGGVESRLWMQNGVTLGTPTAEMVSSITVVFEKGESASVRVDDPAMIAALLETYNGDSIQVLNGKDWMRGSLIIHHKDFPFLQYEVECYYSLEQETSYCKDKNGEWYVLPAQWFVIISEHNFPDRSE